jgi:Tol biopolymer transport system component
MKSISIRWSFLASMVVACGTHPPIDVDDVGSMTSGSGGAGGGSVGGGTTTGGKGTTGGSSSTGGSGGGGASDDAGPPGTQTSCASIVGTLGAASFIAFDSDRDNFRRNLYMMHPDGSELTQLSTGLNGDREPFFSPDGKRLSFTSNVNGQSQISLMDVKSRVSVKLTNRPEGADQSSISRDGQWVAFHSGASAYIIKTDGTGEKLVSTGLADGLNAYHWPAFSIDGTELVFDRNNEIDAVHLDGTGFRYVVSNTTGHIQSPAVSPDGTDVAYQGGCWSDGGVLSIWTTPFATTTQFCMGRRVTPPDDYEAKNPAWATGAIIAYERVDKITNVATIAIISRALGSSPCILTSAANDSRNPTWSPQ